MEKPKKVRKELSRLENFLAKEVDRFDSFLDRQGDRKPLADSQLIPFMPSLAERRRLAAADLAQVRISVARLDAQIGAAKKARVAATDAPATAKSARAPERAGAKDNARTKTGGSKSLASRSGKAAENPLAGENPTAGDAAAAAPAPKAARKPRSPSKPRKSAALDRAG